MIDTRNKGKMMLCPSCKTTRPANQAPCPFCRAASPLASNAWGEQQLASSSSWGGPVTDEGDGMPDQFAFPSSPWQNSSQAAQQMAFPTAAQQGSSFWSQQESAADNPTSGHASEQSHLPVPYREQISPESQALMAIQQPFPPLNQGFNPYLPALPDGDQDGPVYVAPMYTKPRPIIPRYRAISGLVSVVIVFALLCSGAGYYAQVTGKLTFLEKFLGVYSPPAIASTGKMLPVPSFKQTAGPAANNINSAVISDSKNTDAAHGIVANEVNKFNVGDTIYIVCSLPGSQPGTVTVKWYSDTTLYRTQTSTTRDSGANTAVFHSVYAQPAEGKAEIYWNNQLATTLLFVVEPAP